MKRLFFITLLILIMPLLAANCNPPPIKGMYYVHIPEGIFLKVVMQQEISTKSNNLGDEVSAILPVNFYMENTIAIPANSILDGEIVEFAVPKKGRDGLLRVHFDTLTFPDGHVFEFNSDLWMDGKNIIGGNPSELDEIREVPFFAGGLRPGYLLIKPTGEYKIGKDVTIACGAEVLARVSDKIRLNFLE